MTTFRRSLGALGCAALLGLSACTSASDDSTEPSPSIGSYSPPTPNYSDIELVGVFPDDGVTPLLNFMDEAKESLDLAFYEVEFDYKPVIDKLTELKDKGIKIRILISRQLFPPSAESRNQPQLAGLQKLGFDAALSNPKFSYYHEKAIIRDAGTPDVSALVGDYNIGPGYFSASNTYQPNQAGARGMAVLLKNPEDSAELATYFEADWPPYGDWPANTRPNLVWSPAAPQYRAPGNSEAATLWLINSAKKTLDVYAQQVPASSFLLQPILDAAQRGVQVRFVANDGTIGATLDQLQKAGVQVVVNPAPKKGSKKFLYIHTKSIIADGDTDNGVAFVGSVNQFLNVSVETERELGAMVTDEPSVRKVQATFNKDFSLGRPANTTGKTPS